LQIPLYFHLWPFIPVQNPGYLSRGFTPVPDIIQHSFPFYLQLHPYNLHLNNGSASQSWRCRQVPTDESQFCSIVGLVHPAQQISPVRCGARRQWGSIGCPSRGRKAIRTRPISTRIYTIDCPVTVLIFKVD
jgi:hypothetical protein